jgi:tripartite-type tricarboxylate transporter receptor subunit TctC
MRAGYCPRRSPHPIPTIERIPDSHQQGDKMTFPQDPRAGATRRQFLQTTASMAVLGGTQLARAEASAEFKPAGPIRIVVPYPPGGPADVLARIVGPTLSDRFRQPVLVDNRPGATGSIGSEYVYSAKPDGTTLLIGVLDPLSIYPHLVKKSNVDVTRFVPISGIASTALMLMGRPDLPADNLQQLLGLAHKTSLSYASAGNGSGPHMMALVFARAGHLDNLLHVPFAGATPALNALMAKQVDIGFVGVGAAVAFRSRLKVYGVTSATRLPGLADVATLTEQGLPVVGESWQGLLAPPGTPVATTTALANAVQDIVRTPEFQKKVEDLGMTPMLGTQAQFAKYYQDEYKRWGEVVRIEKVTLD